MDSTEAAPAGNGRTPRTDLPARGMRRNRQPRNPGHDTRERRVQQVPLVRSLHPASSKPGELSDSKLAALVYRDAQCARCFIDPDQWFPVSTEIAKARVEAAGAIAICHSCPVRAQCLELSFRHDHGFGAHGVWGGLVESERQPRQRKWQRGTAVAELLLPISPVTDKPISPVAVHRAVPAVPGRPVPARPVIGCRACGRPGADETRPCAC